MAQSFSLKEAERWAKMPELDAATERAAALNAVKFLKDVGAKLEAAAKNPTEGEALHAVYDFCEFDPRHIDFLLAVLGEGEVRITLCKGDAKVADTGIPGLWRMQVGRGGESNAFVLGRIPRAVETVAAEGETVVPERLAISGGVTFAAPAILAELAHLRQTADVESLPVGIPPMVELTRQPLSPDDLTALYATLGTGNVEVDCLGFAKSRIMSTKIQGVWLSRIVNNVGKNLLEAYVVAKIPPEIPVSVEEFADGAQKCRELAEWLEHDLERGVLGAEKRTHENEALRVLMGQSEAQA